MAEKELETIHDLAGQLANMAELDKIVPQSKNEKDHYKALYEKYKLFSKGATEAKKNEIISKLKILNFNEDQIKQLAGDGERQGVLKSISKYNKIIDKKREEIENLIRAGKDVNKNMLYLQNKEKIEVDIQREIRNDLKIYQKTVYLEPANNTGQKNKLKYYSGQNYDFIIKDGFRKSYFINYEKLQKIREEGNVVLYLINEFEKDVQAVYDSDKKRYENTERRKWKNKEKVYKKIFKVIEHNRNIALGKGYNKNLFETDSKGKVVKKEGQYPILMKVFDELIDIYIL